ncbi:MAG: heat-inducible transcriptional repressor HrcA [Methylotetracoccus sp.]
MVNYPDLSDRAQHLFKVLVERYIDDGHPVGSRALARDAGLSLSPATIRNVMADLEELGLITSPHTSAGRMPTASGYRFFVDSLLTVRPLRPDLIEQMQGDLETQDTPEELLETASKLLSDVTRMAGLVTVPRCETRTFRHIEFVPLSERRLLVILVTNDREVQNKIIHCDRTFSPAQLQAAANFLNATCIGRDLAVVRETLSQDLEESRHQIGQELIDAADIVKLALSDRQRRRKPFFLAGETKLMAFSELANMDRLRSLFEVFQQKEDIVHLLDRCLETSGVKIFIGEESGCRSLEPCSVVTASYSVEGQAVGVLGVIGPTRMEYERVIPLVDITARLLGAALHSRS